MARPNNPRYPHSCVIWRQTSGNPLVDEDMEYDPLQDDFSTEQESQIEKEVIYQGVCRAYDRNTVSDKGEVVTSYRGLAIPVTREGWQSLGVCPMEGDSIAVDRGACKEYGIVIDKNPGNFGGTHLIWKYGRN